MWNVQDCLECMPIVFHLSKHENNKENFPLLCRIKTENLHLLSTRFMGFGNVECKFVNSEILFCQIELQSEMGCGMCQRQQNFGFVLSLNEI